MSPHDQKRQSTRFATYRQRWTKRINEKWPGGLDKAVWDYNHRRCTLNDIQRASGVQYRQITKLWRFFGVNIRNGGESCKVAHALHPERGQLVGLKLRTRTSATRPEVRAKMSASKLRLFKEHPECHPNAKQPMSRNERAFADLLTGMQIDWEFNKSAAPYWLDFYLPDLRVGFEIQRDNRPAEQERDASVSGQMSAPIIYVRVSTIQRRPLYVGALLDFIRAGFDVLTLGDYRMLAHRPWKYRKTLRVGEFVFIEPWLVKGATTELKHFP